MLTWNLLRPSLNATTVLDTGALADKSCLFRLTKLASKCWRDGYQIWQAIGSTLPGITKEGSYRLFQGCGRRKCEGVQSSHCSIQQEFQVGERELCKQLLLRPGRDKNVESLRHWPWEEYSLDKVRCPSTGTSVNGDHTLDQRDYHKLRSSKTQTNRWPNACYWDRRQLRLPCRWVIRWVKRRCWCR